MSKKKKKRKTSGKNIKPAVKDKKTKKRGPEKAKYKKPANRKKKALIISLIVLISLALICVIYGAIVYFAVGNSALDRIYTLSDPLPDKDGYDCIIILGCGVHDDGTPSAMLEDRIKTGAELYKAGAAPKILVSGDHGTVGYDEVNTMKDLLIGMDIPSEDIFMDHAGFSTYESMYRANAVFGVKRAIVVTQDFHLPRAVYDAGENGIESIGVSADLRRYAGVKFNYIREIPGRIKDHLFCLFNVNPTYLGESIDITGSGDITNDK